MGIPKLFGKLEQYQHVRSREFFKGADFYVDGCNFNHSREELFAEQGFLNIFRANVELLKSLEPNSISIYYDASFPPSKIPVKINRIRQKLAKLNWDGELAINELSLEVLMDEYPEIDVVITGTEAEDQIFWDLCQKPTPFAREQIVFSSDSDCFTFSVPGAERIHIASVKDVNKWPGQITTHRMSEVMRSSAVVNRLHAPPKPTGITVRNPTTPDTDCQELVNMLKSYGEPIMFLTMLPPVVTDPWQVGLKFRVAAYAQLIGDNMVVDEYRQHNFDTHCHKVTSSVAQTAELIELVKDDIAEVITNEAIEFLKGTEYEVTSKTKLRQYLESLKTSKVYNIRVKFGPNEEYDEDLYQLCQVWCVVVLALFMSMRFFRSSLQLKVEAYKIGWKLNPNELYTLLK